jgi:hypothetical protein
MVDADFWVDPWGRPNAYQIKSDGGPNDPVSIFLEYGKVATAEPTDPNLGFHYNLSPDGKLTDALNGNKVL